MLIFFDVDGVLIDGWHADIARRKPWDARLREDLGVDRDAFQRLFFTVCPGRTTSRMADCVTGQRDLTEALAEILPEIGFSGGAEAFMRYWFTADSRLYQPVFAAIDVLRAAPGVRLFLATGQERHRAAYLWHELRFRDRFEAMFYSADIGVPKKNPLFYQTIMQRLAIAPQERPLLFDDQPELVALANTLGWDATIFRSVDDVLTHPRLRPLLHCATPNRPA